MGSFLNIFRATLVHVGYISYFTLLYWRLRAILENEKQFNDSATLTLGILLGIMLAIVQTGLWVYYILPRRHRT